MLSTSKVFPLILSLVTGLLLFAAWPPSALNVLIFISFVPLLWLEHIAKRRLKFFGWVYLTMVVWNMGTTWWVCNSTLPGGISAILANSLLMCIPWIGFYNVKRTLGPGFGYPALILFWMTFEYIHLNWELTWPWLTLGNVFATHPDWVQWYEYTGVSGGTLWVLATNIFFFLLLKGQREKLPLDTKTITGLVVSLILLPGISQMLKPNPLLLSSNNHTHSNIVVVQPDIDPYQKTVPGEAAEEIHKMIALSESFIDSNTALVVWPETAIPDQVDEDAMKSNPLMTPVWAFLKSHPRIDLLTGVEGYRLFDQAHKTPSCDKVPGTNEYIESYNSAALLDSNDFQIYHKSKLVPGVEALPSFLKFMVPLFEKFGGATGSYTRQAKRTVFLTSNNSYRIAPAVCYESIYGEFMGDYVRGGANLIVVITNDGWWGNTAGYKQHENYARLRAIETRRWVARSANTGISCFIDPSGRVINPQPWNETAVAKRSIPAETGMTFYVKYGDLLSRLAILLAILLTLWDFRVIISRKFGHG